jgi:hypothetical protein
MDALEHFVLQQLRLHAQILRKDMSARILVLQHQEDTLAIFTRNIIHIIVMIQLHQQHRKNILS